MAGKRWTQKDIDKLAGKGLKIVEKCSPKRTIVSKKASNKTEPEGLRFIKQTLTLLKIPFVLEHRFHPPRKYRFDVAFPDEKIAIEYEGLNSDKSRHTTIGGYTNDCRKYNLAQSNGWRVLRYTAANYKEFYNELKALLDA